MTRSGPSRDVTMAQDAPAASPATDRHALL
jgi:hypothetical protein